MRLKDTQGVIENTFLHVKILLFFFLSSTDIKTISASEYYVQENPNVRMNDDKNSNDIKSEKLRIE